MVQKDACRVTYAQFMTKEEEEREEQEKRGFYCFAEEGSEFRSFLRGRCMPGRAPGRKEFEIGVEAGACVLLLQDLLQSCSRGGNSWFISFLSYPASLASSREAE